LLKINYNTILAGCFRQQKQSFLKIGMRGPVNGFERY